MGGVMKYYASGKALADEMKIDVATLKKTFEDYNTNGEKQTKDPEGGPYDAYPSGKSWDTWGKKFYHNLPVEVEDEFHVAIVTPVIHYCMGGLQVTEKSAATRSWTAWSSAASRAASARTGCSGRTASSASSRRRFRLVQPQAGSCPIRILGNLNPPRTPFSDWCV